MFRYKFNLYNFILVVCLPNINRLLDLIYIYRKNKKKRVNTMERYKATKTWFYCALFQQIILMFEHDYSHYLFEFINFKL